MPDRTSAQTHRAIGWRWPLLAVALFCLGGIAAIAMAGHWAGRSKATGTAANWTEITWPFPVDEWGKGKAMHCPAPGCGTDISIYLRPKIGFCNCTSGVADDMEIDRVSDFVLLGDGVVPLGEGKPIQVGSMTGRTRLYRFARHDGQRVAISAAFSSNCDVIIATAIVDPQKVALAQPRMLEFLGSDYVLGWAKLELGL